MIKITVNATSANVCVGFDVLGIALAIPNYFTFENSDSFEFIGFDSKYTFENNMVYNAYLKTFDMANLNPIPVKIGFKGEIPICRGLGSSSSLIVAGVLAANYYLGDRFNKNEILDICTSIEGHPDNVAPAIFGGLIASYKDKDGYKIIRHEVSNELYFITVIPSQMIKTEEARKVLPKVLDYSSIVNNLSRIVNIPYAFKTGDLDLLCSLFQDKLHEPYRMKLINDYDKVKAIALKYNYPFAISGSGSTMLLITKNNSVPSELAFIDTKLVKLGLGATVEEI